LLQLTQSAENPTSDEAEPAILPLATFSFAGDCPWFWFRHVRAKLERWLSIDSPATWTKLQHVTKPTSLPNRFDQARSLRAK
jgi:hypothetical protein